MRNVTAVLSATDMAKAEFYASVCEGYIGDDSGSVVVFDYTDRVKGVTTERESTVIEFVGERGKSTWGFKGMTPKGPRTFNFYLMDGKA